MKAAVYHGPGDIRLQDVPTPTPAAGEVLLRVRACAICGTDLRIFTHGQKNVVPPRITGHEIAGEIAEIGTGVTGDFKVGDKATVVTCVGCLKCPYCAKGVYNLCDDPKYLGYFYDGGFAEYMIIPEQAVRGGNIVVVDPKLSFAEIAMIEPMSCCINGQDYLRIERGDTVVVFGAGPIGNMHAELAHAAGASRIIMIDILDARLQASRKCYVTDTINSKNEDPLARVMELTGGRGADVVITAAGVKSIQELAIGMAAKLGRISWFASIPKDDPIVKFDSNVPHYKEISIFGVFASNRRHFDKAARLIASGQVDARKFATHTFPLERIVAGFENSRAGNGLKTVITID
jgi:L-iditol 2-dehydrogenase